MPRKKTPTKREQFQALQEEFAAKQTAAMEETIELLNGKDVSNLEDDLRALLEDCAPGDFMDQFINNLLRSIANTRAALVQVKEQRDQALAAQKEAAEKDADE